MGRTEEFPPDGVRIRVAPAKAAITWRRYSNRIGVQYALGTMQHETNFTLNEVDTEVSGFVSKGVYQLSDEEAKSVDMGEADLRDLDQATDVMTTLSEWRLDQILAVAPSVDAGDARAWLALAHNEGLSKALKSVEKHGGDWQAFCDENANTDYGRRIIPYGNDCISGGDNWRAIYSVANLSTVSLWAVGLGLAALSALGLAWLFSSSGTKVPA